MVKSKETASIKAGVRLNKADDDINGLKKTTKRDKEGIIKEVTANEALRRERGSGNNVIYRLKKPEYSIKLGPERQTIEKCIASARQHNGAATFPCLRVREHGCKHIPDYSQCQWDVDLEQQKVHGRLDGSGGGRQSEPAPQEEQGQENLLIVYTKVKSNLIQTRVLAEKGYQEYYG